MAKGQFKKSKEDVIADVTVGYQIEGRLIALEVKQFAARYAARLAACIETETEKVWLTAGGLTMKLKSIPVGTVIRCTCTGKTEYKAGEGFTWDVEEYEEYPGETLPF